MNTAIKAEGVTKSYGRHVVLDHVSIAVEPGEIYGFIGPNGAGKTTLMKILVGLIEANEGSVSFFDGMKLSQARRQVGSLIEEPAYYPNCSGIENLRRYAILTGDNEVEIKDVLRSVGLENAANKKVAHYSLGMKQRLGIAMALLGHPKALVLDEPNNGLDPEGIRDMRELLLRLAREEGIAILISSHMLDELSRVSTRFGLINGGKLVKEISAKELQEQCFAGLYVATPMVKEAIAALQEAGLTGPNDYYSNDSLFLKRKDIAALEVSKSLFGANIPVSALEERHTDIEDYVLNILKGAIR